MHSASVTSQSLVENVGKMCRHCFNMFERASKLWQGLKIDTVKAADAYVPHNAPLATIPHRCDAPSTPKRPRLSDQQEGQSPEVKVSKLLMLPNCKPFLLK